MTQIASAIDLRFAVSDLVGNRTIGDVFKRLVQSAEVALNRHLRTTWQITSDTLAFTNGAADLPADFLEMIDVYGPLGSRLMAGARFDSRRPGTSRSTYSIASGKIYIRGFGGSSDILYYAALPTINDSGNDPNWLLQQYPEAYVYAVGFEAAKFLKDQELATTIAALLASQIETVMIDDERQRWANSIVRVQAQTP